MRATVGDKPWDVGAAKGADEFWRSERVAQAEEQLDIWASVHHARATGSGTPTVDAALGMVPQVTVREYGALNVRPAAGPNVEMRMLGPAAVSYMAVETAISRMGVPEIVRGVLLSLYPRDGNYAASGAGWMDRRLERGVRQIQRAAIEEILRRRIHGRRRGG